MSKRAIFFVTWKLLVMLSYANKVSLPSQRLIESKMTFSSSKNYLGAAMMTTSTAVSTRESLKAKRRPRKTQRPRRVPIATSKIVTQGNLTIETIMNISLMTDNTANRKHPYTFRTLANGQSVR